jgi:uncharacterized membrane protein YkvA (DUF1232 family)
VLSTDAEERPARNECAPEDCGSPRVTHASPVKTKDSSAQTRASARAAALLSDPSAPPEQTSPARRGGISKVPVIGDIVATARLLRDREAALWAKLLVALAVAYVVFPLDAVPDLAPIVGWLDDAGALVVLRVLLHNKLSAYRYPLNEPPPRLPPEAAPAPELAKERDKIDAGPAGA